jgi:hypothetical protein
LLLVDVEETAKENCFQGKSRRKKEEEEEERYSDVLVR